MNVDSEVRDRFWAKVVKSDGCWEWSAARTGHGYGNFSFRDGERKQHWVSAHRMSYLLLVGEIPQGLHIDHLCRNRLCVNPDHLEPVTPGENLLRGETVTARNASRTHCPRGHAREKWRRCRVCDRLRKRKSSLTVEAA